MLDSLQSRGDWQRMYAIQTARLNNREESLTHYEWLDSLSKVQLVVCDSALRKQYTEINELRAENVSLRRRLKNRSFFSPAPVIEKVASFVAGFFLGSKR